MQEVVFQVSLVAAFIAGMVALFAPCCITFLLPAYLGSVFKEKEKVLFMTFVFGLGIFVVLLPAVLGVAAISKFVFAYHDIVYIIGGMAMLFIAFLTFLGIKFPMPKLPAIEPGKTDVVSVFTLGIISGITSACCAPVLMGILTLTFLSPNFFGALGIGGVYVLGMLAPLFVISLFLSGKATKFMVLRKPMFTLSLFGQHYTVLVGNLIASVIFFLTGILILVLTRTGALSMVDTTSFTKLIQNTGFWVDRYGGENVLVNIGFVIFLAIGIFFIVKQIRKGR